MEQERILVVEDDLALAQALAQELRRGHHAHVVHTGRDALIQAATLEFDLIVLDLNLPDMDGLDVAQQLQGTQTPILMLTARADVRSRVAGLYAGASDYLAKPFEMEEFLARVYAQLRRRLRDVEYGWGPLIISPSRRTCSVDGVPLPLTALEYRLLALLMAGQGRVYSKDTLHERLYDDTMPASNAVEALVSRLRTKLADAGVENVVQNLRGLGYVIRP